MSRRSIRWGAAAVTLALAGCGPHPVGPTPPPGPCALALPPQGAYTGAYIDFGPREDDVTLERIENFEQLVGKHQAIIASSSYWGEQSFPAATVAMVFRHGSVPLLFWSPWDRPYEENRGPDKFALTAIVAGAWDAYLDRWGDGARAFGQPLLVSLMNEPNGDWFPWSGYFYGAGEEVPGATPPKFRGPETFKAAWRHIVDRVRARGARNVQWVFHVMNYGYPVDVWNMSAQYYPGTEYADWIGLSIYGSQFPNTPWWAFAPLADWPYEELCGIAADKPFMAAEWGVGEFRQAGNKAAWFTEAFACLRRYPRLKAAIYWHERWQNADESYSNLRVNSSPEALAAYRAGVAEPFWLDRPLLVPRQ